MIEKILYKCGNELIIIFWNILGLRSYVINTILNFEIETLKSILLTRIVHIRALTLLNVLVPCESLKRSLLLVLDYEY